MDILTNNEEITFKYTTKPIGKVVKQETFPTGIEFTINLDVEGRSDEEVSELIKYISKYGLFKNTLFHIHKQGFTKVDIKYVDIMCERINNQTKALEFLHDDKMEEDLERLFWDIQILLRTMENEIEGKRKKDSNIIWGVDLANGKDEVGYFDD